MIYGSPDQRSGGYLYDRQLADALAERSHEVEWVSLARAARYRDERRGDATGLWVNQTVGLDPGLILIDELNHAAVLDGLADLSRRAPAAPVVAMVHHLRRDEPRHGPTERRLAHVREKRFLRACDAWLLNGEVTRRRVRRVAGTARPSATALPGADALLDATAGAPARAPGPPWRVLFVGSVIPRKNVASLVRLVAERHNLELEIVGDATIDPDYTGHLSSLVRSYRLGDRVTFSGPLGPADLRAAYARAHLFVAPSWYEGYGIVYAEALMAGLPTIATSRGGAREVLGPRLTDWLVDPRDRRGLARTISSIVATPETWERASNRAWQRARNLPRWQRSMQGAVRFLEQIYRARNSTSL